MSSPKLETLREKTLEHGSRLGWRALGSAVGMDGETLRVFATNPKRGAHPATVRALEDYFDPPIVPSQVAADIKSALERARDTVAFLESLHRTIRVGTVIGDADDHLDDPIEDTTPIAPADAKPAKKRRRGSG